MAIPASVFHRDRTLAAGGFATLPIREDTNLYFALCLEGSVCAVLGAGAATTGDAGAARLTGVHSPASLVYCECSVRMYREVRARAARRGSPHVRALTGRLAMSHRHLATAQWRDGRRAAALASAARAFARAPFVTAGALLGRATSVSK
jgi:hypothetical protein